MKTGKTLPELAAELDRRKAAMNDFIVDTRQMNMTSDGKQLVLPGAGPLYNITDYAHGQIAEYTQIPKAYYDKMKSELPALLQRNVGEWFNKKAEPRMVRTLDGRARALLSNKFKRVDNHDVANAALEALLSNFGNGIEIISCDVTDSRLYIKALFPRKEIVPSVTRVNDEIQAGVVIANGEIGNGSTSVRAMSYRLWCLNGATHEHTLRQAHVGKALTSDDNGIIFKDDTIAADEAAMILKIRDAISNTQGEPFTRIIETQRALAGAPPIPKPIAAMEVLAKKIGFTQERKESILERLLKGGDHTPFGFCQAVTSLANDVKDYDDASDLETLGGRLMVMPANDWKELALAA